MEGGGELAKLAGWAVSGGEWLGALLLPPKRPVAGREAAGRGGPRVYGLLRSEANSRSYLHEKAAGVYISPFVLQEIFIIR